MSILHSDVEISSSYYVLQVIFSSGMSSGSMNGGVWISLVGYVLGGVMGVVYGGGRDIGVVSMVLTLGWGGGCGFLRLVCLTSFRSSSGLLFSAGFFFASRVPLCLRARGFGAFVFLQL